MKKTLKESLNFIWKGLIVMSTIFLFSSYAHAQVCSVDLWTSEDFSTILHVSGQNIDSREMTLVWDLDGDWIPEVVVDDYKDPWKIYVLNGTDLTTKHVLNTGRDLNQNNSANGIADVDGNGYGEIYFIEDNMNPATGSSWRLCDAAYPCKMYRRDFDWTTWSETRVSDWPARDRYTPSFADFNGDGNAEIYMWSQIFRASDWVKILDAWFNPTDLGWSNAMDILPDNYLFVDGPRAWTICNDCQGLELAVGSRVFTVDVLLWTITLATEDWSWVAWRWGDAIADMDNDGDVDIVYTWAVGGDAHLFIRDGQTSEQLMVIEVNDTRASIWRPNIADFDGDGCNEIWVVTRSRYSVIDDVFTDDGWCPGPNLTWSTTNIWWSVLRSINNSDTSWVTWSSVFDFNLDGIYEVIYRDQSNLFILAWPNWDELSTPFPCTSWTRWENPVIVDVNNDWATEIVVACNNIGVSVFRSWADAWAPSRPVWNQHGYNVTNVNDDLTIPAVPLYNPTHAGGAHDNYLAQSLPVDSNFVPTNSLLPPGHVFAADAQLTIQTVDVTQCSTSMTIDVLVENVWDTSLPASTPIKIYDNDPTIFSSNVLWSWIVWSVLWTWTNTLVTIPMTSCSSPVFAIVNDDSPQTPYTLSWSALFPNTSTAECLYENNIDATLFSYCGDGLLDVGEECDDPKICSDGSTCADDIDCDSDITDWLVLHHQFQWWSLTDLSGNGNDGVLMWDAKIVNWITDESLSFDWYDDRMMVPHSSSVDLTTDITISARVYPRQFGFGQWSGDFSAILTKWAAYYLNLNAAWRPQFYRYGLSSPWYHTAPNPLPLNTRSHVSATYDWVAGTISLYVDGVLQLTAASTWNWTQNTQNIWIGRYPWFDVRELDGVVDDVRVYDRPLLASEIDQLYQNWLDVCEGNTDNGDWCSDQCEFEYCRDDAPLNDTSKNFIVTDLTSGAIAWTSTQNSAKVAICFEDMTGTRDIFFTTTDANGAFSYAPNLAPYASPWINVWVMLHDENDLDIDHHSLILVK